MQQTNWVIVTGGPSSGKTTLLGYLRSRGYQIIPEAARVLIDEEIVKGRMLQDIRADEAVFQKKVLEMKVEIEGKLDPLGLAFLDRGIPDSVAYYQICGEDYTPALKESQKRRYRAVFLCEQVSFENDYARTEDQKSAHEIGKLLNEAYTALGYEVVSIPLMSVEERAEFILKELNRF